MSKLLLKLKATSKDLPKTIMVTSAKKIDLITTLQNLTLKLVSDIPLDNPTVLSLFYDTLPLNLSSEEIFCDNLTRGLYFYHSLTLDHKLSTLRPKTITKLTKILTSSYPNYFKDSSKAYNEVIYSYLLAYYKLYYPIFFYQALLEVEQYLFDYSLISKGYQKVKDYLLFLNDVSLETLEPKKLSASEKLLEQGLLILLEITALNIPLTLRVDPNFSSDNYYQVDFQNYTSINLIIKGESKHECQNN